MSRLPRLTILTSAIIWSLFIGSIVGFCAFKFIKAATEDGLAQHIVNMSSQINNNLIASQSGERGYIITGDQTFLKPYEETKLVIDEEIDALKAASDSVHTNINVDQIILLARERMKTTAVSIAARSAMDLETFAKTYSANHGEEQIDELHSLIVNLQNEQTEASTKSGSMAQIYAKIIVAGIVWLFLCLFVDIVMISNYYKNNRLRPVFKFRFMSKEI